MDSSNLTILPHHTHSTLSMLNSDNFNDNHVTIITMDGILHTDARLTLSHILQISFNQIILEFSRCDCFTAMPSTSRGTLHRISSPSVSIYLPMLEQHILCHLQSFFNPFSSYLGSSSDISHSQLECMYWVETLLIDTKGRLKRKLGRPRKSSLGVGELCLDLPLTSIYSITTQRSSTITVNSIEKSIPIKPITNVNAESDADTLNGPFNTKNGNNFVEEKERQCLECNRKHTPLWRRGPLGMGTLCNACGVKWNKQLKQRQNANNNTSINSNMDNTLDRRHSITTYNDVQKHEPHEHTKNYIQEKRITTIDGAETVPVPDNTDNQMINPKAKTITFIAPLKKRKVILD